MAQETVRVKGLRQVHSAFKRYDTGLKLELERDLREGGAIVERAATALFSGIDPSEPSGYAVNLRGFGRVSVRGKRSKGRRGDFGALLMRRSLLPALSDNADKVIQSIETMLDTLGREFNR